MVKLNATLLVDIAQSPSLVRARSPTPTRSEQLNDRVPLWILSPYVWVCSVGVECGELNDRVRYILLRIGKIVEFKGEFDVFTHVI